MMSKLTIIFAHAEGFGEVVDDWVEYVGFACEFGFGWGFGCGFGSGLGVGLGVVE